MHLMDDGFSPHHFTVSDHDLVVRIRVHPCGVITTVFYNLK